MAWEFIACRQQVHNRGRPPVEFLVELAEWGRDAPEEIFTINNRHDVYTNIRDELGPWDTVTERRAAMLEALRVLAGFESSWDWEEGRDITNPNSNTSCTEEAGILQCSGDSMNFDGSLREFVRSVAGSDDCDTFRDTTKANHPFALEYCARLLRFTVRHHGPVRDGHINPWLRRDAMDEYLRFFAEA